MATTYKNTRVLQEQYLSRANKNAPAKCDIEGWRKTFISFYPVYENGGRCFCPFLTIGVTTRRAITTAIDKVRRSAGGNDDLLNSEPLKGEALKDYLLNL